MDSGPAAANSAGALALEASREGGPHTFRKHGAEGPLLLASVLRTRTVYVISPSADMI